jgi:hypothetical protein
MANTSRIVLRRAVWGNVNLPPGMLAMLESQRRGGQACRLNRFPILTTKTTLAPHVDGVVSVGVPLEEMDWFLYNWPFPNSCGFLQGKVL